MSELHPEVKSALDGIRTSVEGFNERLSNLQKQTDAIDVQLQRPGGYFSAGEKRDDIAQKLWDSDELKSLRDKGRGRIIIKAGSLADLLERKTTITSSAVGSSTSGVLTIQRDPAVQPLAMRRVRLLDIVPRKTMNQSAVDFVKVSSATLLASPQSYDGAAKSEAELNFESVSRPAQTFAVWVPASRQVLDDFQQLQAAIDTHLTWAVQAMIESQILSGSGIAPNLSGMTTEAQAFDTSLLSASAGWEKVDILRRAAQQVEASDETQPDFVVLHPDDYADIELMKESTGRYIFADPGTPGPAKVWGMTPIVTTAMSSGYFLVGASRACALWDRSSLTLDISTEHSDFFVKNLIAVRAEMRCAFTVYRPNAFVWGSLTQSPA